MEIFDIMTTIENQSVQIERARAVLDEATSYHDRLVKPNSDEANYLAIKSEHILMLLHVTDGLLRGILPALEEAVDALMEHYRATERGAVREIESEVPELTAQKLAVNRRC